jgi:hypothetical protein
LSIRCSWVTMTEVLVLSFNNLLYNDIELFKSA